jgi:hypothetical protein
MITVHPLSSELVVQRLIVEGQHATVGVMDDDDLLSVEELLRDGEGTKGVVYSTTGVTDDMSITLLQTSETTGLKTLNRERRKGREERDEKEEGWD